MKRMNVYMICGILCGFVLVSGCRSERSAQLKTETFVGEYVYYCADKGAQHDPDVLTLRADGKYVLVRMPGGHPASQEQGTWRLVEGSTPSILLDHAGYPIRVQGNQARLLIDDDLGQWYEKRR